MNLAEPSRSMPRFMIFSIVMISFLCAAPFMMFPRFKTGAGDDWNPDMNAISRENEGTWMFQGETNESFFYIKFRLNGSVALITCAASINNVSEFHEEETNFHEANQTMIFEGFGTLNITDGLIILLFGFPTLEMNLSFVLLGGWWGQKDFSSIYNSQRINIFAPFGYNSTVSGQLTSNTTSGIYINSPASCVYATAASSLGSYTCLISDTGASLALGIDIKFHDEYLGVACGKYCVYSIDGVGPTGVTALNAWCTGVNDERFPVITGASGSFYKQMKIKDNSIFIETGSHYIFIEFKSPARLNVSTGMGRVLNTPVNVLIYEKMTSAPPQDTVLQLPYARLIVNRSTHATIDSCGFLD